MRSLNSQNQKSGLLLDVYDRDAGEFTNQSGKLITYGAATVLVILPLWDAKGAVQKIKVHPSAVASIKEETENWSWASLIKVTLAGKEAVAVELIQEPFGSITLEH